MNEVVVWSFKDECHRTYLVPTKDDALKRMTDTWGKRYDRIEREVVEGGVPVPWAVKENT